MEAAENMKSEQEEIPDAAPEDRSDDTETESNATLSIRSLRRLRDRVERAAHELRLLREENSSLQDRVAELEALSPESAPEGGALFIESDPESVKRKVEGFIQAIDRYLDAPDRT